MNVCFKIQPFLYLYDIYLHYLLRLLKALKKSHITSPAVIDTFRECLVPH